MYIYRVCVPPERWIIVVIVMALHFVSGTNFLSEKWTSTTKLQLPLLFLVFLWIRFENFTPTFQLPLHADLTPGNAIRLGTFNMSIEEISSMLNSDSFEYATDNAPGKPHVSEPAEYDEGTKNCH